MLFKRTIRMIKQFPFIGKQIEGLPDRGVVTGAYLIVYAAIDDAVIIERIWDARRNPEDFKL